MAKQKVKETPQEQARRFQAEVEKMVAAGELSSIEAEAALDKPVRKKSATTPQDS